MALQNLIKLRRSSVPGKTPLTTDLSLGELAINTNDGKMFLKKDDGAESIVEVLSNLTGLQLSGGTLTGFLTLHADPTNALHAATKQYVDANGGSITPDFDGTLTFQIDASSSISPVGNASAVVGSVGDPAMTALDSNTVAFIDGVPDNLGTYTFDGTNWSQVGNTLNIPANEFAIAALNSTTVALVVAGFPTPDELRTYSWDGTNWAQVGNSLSITSGNTQSVAALDSTTVAVWQNNTDELRTYSWDGTDWTPVGNAFTDPVAIVEITELDSTTIAAIESTNNELRTYSWDGTDWTQVGSGTVINVNFIYGAIVNLNSTQVIIADADTDDFYLYTWNGSTWSLDLTYNVTPLWANYSAFAALSPSRIVHIETASDSLQAYDISQPGNKIIDDGSTNTLNTIFSAGDTIRVSKTTSNNGLYTINSFQDANTILVDSVVAEASVDATLIKDSDSFGQTEQTKLAGIETGATADQTDAEIETAYNNQVSVVTQGDAEAGTSTTVYRWTPQRIAQAIAALATGGVDSVFGRTGAVVAAASDYDASQVDNDSTVTGATVKDALETLDAGSASAEAYDITAGEDNSETFSYGQFMQAFNFGRGRDFLYAQRNNSPSWTIDRYTVSDPDDISTASLASSGSHPNRYSSIYVVNSGTRVIGLDPSNRQFQQSNWSSAYNPSSGGFDNGTFSVSGQGSNTQDGAVVEALEKAYVLSSGSDTIYEYDIPGGDVTAMSYTGRSFNHNAIVASASEVEVSHDGKYLFLLDGGPGIVYKLEMTTPGRIDTCVDTGDTLDVETLLGTGNNINSMKFEDFGLKLYVNESVTNTIKAIDIATNYAFTYDEKVKLSGIEDGATADQTGAEIKALYEAEADTNAFTDAEQTKLSGIETGAEVNDVDSVFGRTGPVVAAASDYDASQIDNDSTVTGATVKDALETLDAAIVTTTDVVRDEFVDGVDFTAGTTTQLTLTNTPPDTDSILIFFDGGYQQFDSWSIATDTITFTAAIPLGVQRVEVIYGIVTGGGSEAYLDVVQQFTAQHGFAPATLSDGANISWDLTNAQVAEVTLAGNRTLDNPSNQQAGTTYILFVKQDGTGSRTLGFGDAYYWEGDVAPTLSTGANATDVLVFVSDGTRMLGQYSLNYSEAPTGTLVDAVASACGDLDATKSDSYSGSGETWANIITAPADGSLQADYDMWLGEAGTTDGDELTFTGSAGDSAAYFLADGGDHFKMKNNTTLIDGFHTDAAQSWWLATAFQFAGGTSAQPILLSTGGHNASNEGVECFIGGTTSPASIRVRLNLTRNGTRTVTNFNTAGFFTSGSDYLLVISYDHTTDTIRVWKNGTGETSADINSGTGSTLPINNYQLGRRANGANHINNGFRIYHQSFGNSFLSDGDESSIRSHLEARHSRTYNAS
jgi:hypothetical protein